MPGSHCAFTVGTYSDSLNKHLWRKADCFNVAIYFHWPAETELSIVWWILIQFWLWSPVSGCVSSLFQASNSRHRFLSSEHITLLCRRQRLIYTLHKKSDQSEASKLRKQCGKNVKHQFEGSEKWVEKNELDWNGIFQITHSITNLQRWA